MLGYSVVQEPVTAAVWYALNNYCYENAIFIAERLHAEVHSMDTTFLLATCYYRSGQLQQAKHLLNKEKSCVLNHPRCTVLYAQCCLDLEDYMQGVLALNGVLNVQENAESSIRNHFGDDVGVAFFILGKLKYQLHHKPDAAKCFRAALRFNPFLWSAFSMLCEMGEDANPEECFKVTQYPKFLATRSSAPPTSLSALSSDCIRPKAECASMNRSTSHPFFSPMGPKSDDLVGHFGSTGERPGSAFKPVRKSKPVLMTPDIFQDTPVESAMASSTPAAEMRKLPRRAKGPGVPGRRIEWVGTVGALDFGSGGERAAKATPLGLSSGPVTPSFGVLSLSTHDSEAPIAKNVEKVLNFSVTPSPTPLPSDYLKLLQSAPKSLRKATASRQELPRGRAVPIPSPLASKLDQEFPMFRLGSQSPTSLGGRRTESPHPLTKSLGPMEHRSPLKSGRGGTSSGRLGVEGLRRSSRLSGGGGSSGRTSPAANRRLSEHAIHTTKGKSRLKSPTSVRRNIEARSSKKAQGSSNFGSASRGSATPTNLKAASVKTQYSVESSVNMSQKRRGGPSNPLSPVMEAEGTMKTEDEEMITEDTSAEALKDGKEEGVEDAVHLLEKAAMAGLTSFTQLLLCLGRAYQALMKYDLGKAVRAFQSLPTHHWETPWVLGQVARAYFAAERFEQSVKLFKRVHAMDPHRQEGMELYSSALWHLKQEVELSVLAQHLHSSHKLRPQAMCAMASLKNLYKEHEAAISQLTTATTVCPNFAYCHTLLGHEYWLAKDYDKALASFQRAVYIQPRHYNAWYGMAHVSFFQEKYEEAEMYAKRALGINGCSSISCTQMGLAQFRLGRHDQALSSFNRALSINPFNPIPRFHKAKALEAKGLLEDSLEELSVLVKKWPKEPSIYVSRGKILKRLNRTHEAALQFSWALDFTCSGQNSQLREEIDQTYHNQNSLDRRDDSDGFLELDDSQEEEEEEEDSLEGVGLGGVAEDDASF